MATKPPPKNERLARAQPSLRTFWRMVDLSRATPGATGARIENEHIVATDKRGTVLSREPVNLELARYHLQVEAEARATIAKSEAILARHKTEAATRKR